MIPRFVPQVASSVSSDRYGSCWCFSSFLLSSSSVSDCSASFHSSHSSSVHSCSSSYRYSQRFCGKEPLPCLQPGAFSPARLPPSERFPPPAPFRFIACLPSPIPAGRSLPQRPPSPKDRCAIHSASPSPAQTLRFAPAVARARPPGFGSFRCAPSKKSLSRFANPGQRAGDFAFAPPMEGEAATCAARFQFDFTKDKCQNAQPHKTRNRRDPPP